MRCASVCQWVLLILSPSQGIYILFTGIETDIHLYHYDNSFRSRCRVIVDEIADEKTWANTWGWDCRQRCIWFWAKVRRYTIHRKPSDDELTRLQRKNLVWIGNSDFGGGGDDSQTATTCSYCLFDISANAKYSNQWVCVCVSVRFIIIYFENMKTQWAACSYAINITLSTRRCIKRPIIIVTHPVGSRLHTNTRAIFQVHVVHCFQRNAKKMKIETNFIYCHWIASMFILSKRTALATMQLIPVLGTTRSRAIPANK